MIHPSKIETSNQMGFLNRLHEWFVEDARPLTRKVAQESLAKESGWFRTWLRDHK